MISEPSGARVLKLVCVGRIVGLVAPLRLAALPFRKRSATLEAELLAAVVLADCIGSAIVMRWMFILAVLLFRGRLESIADVLKGIRWEALLKYWNAVCRHGPCGPICSLHP